MKMFITAAPVGSVAKYIDPFAIRFIPDEWLQNFVSDSKKDYYFSVLQENGWERVSAGGLGLNIGVSGCITNEELNELTTEERQNAIEYMKGGNWENGPSGWLKNTQKTQGHIKEEYKRNLALLLTTQGWIDDGDLYGLSAETYIPKEFVQDMTQELLDYLLSEGFQYCCAGYWQPAKTMSPYIPIFPKRIIEEVRRCKEEGAAIVQLHTRNLKTQKSWSMPGLNMSFLNFSQTSEIDLDQYDEIIPEIVQNDQNIILNLSTNIKNSSKHTKNISDIPHRRAHLKAYGVAAVMPDFASFTPGPIIFQNGIEYDNSEAFLRAQAAYLKKHNIRPEIEIFSRTVLYRALGDYKEMIQTMSCPLFFMLAVGGDQWTNWSHSHKKNEDDSLIPAKERIKIFDLLKNGVRKEAIDLTVRYLSPVINLIRKHHPNAKISMGMAGIMQTILADIAVILKLDGVRVGMEDGLNVYKDGYVRRAIGTSEQVRIIKQQLESKNVSIITAEELRENLNATKAEFHQSCA